MKLKRLSLFFLFILMLLTSCKTMVKPIVYDKTVKIIREELYIITLMLESGKLQEAENRLYKNLSLYNNNLELLTLKVFLFIKQDKIKEALELIDKLLDVNLKNPLLYVALAEIEIINGNYERAEELLEQCFSISTQIGAAWYQQGLLAFIGKDYRKASSSFQRAYFLDFKNPKIQFFRYLCRLYLTKDLDGNKEEWYRLYKELITPQAYYYIFHVQALYDIGAKSDAERILQEGLTLYPEDPYLLNQKICFLLEFYRQNPSETEISWEEIGKITGLILQKLTLPDTVDTYFQYLSLSDQREKLKREYKKYISIFPNSSILQDWGKIVNENEITGM